NDTLLVTNPGAFTNQISITDAAASTSVTFDNGTNTYTNNFNINLSNAQAGAITFNGTTMFSGASTLTAATTDFITVNPGATVETSSGKLTLTATGTVAGAFAGIDVNGGTVHSGRGSVLLQGQGGHLGVWDRGEVSAGGSGSVTVTGTSGPGSSNVGVSVEGSV